MTVTPSASDVADKAVSTEEDVGGGVEVTRLDAVLAALVKTKVEAIKASSIPGRRSDSAPASPRRLRLTSTSTASSSLNHHIHHHHQYRRKSHHHHHHHHHHRHRHRRRRHDSAPCGEFIEDVASHHRYKFNNGKSRRRSSESPHSPRKRRRHSKSPHVLHGIVQDIHTGLDSRFELLGIDAEQDVALINFERTREALNGSYEYPGLHRNACYLPHSAAQLKLSYDDDEYGEDDDYVALNMADEFDDEETISGPEKVEEPREKYHRPRRKRKRKRRKIDPVGTEEELTEPEELPPRARWTIVATACLLLAMSLLLVGVTLRMAPIIDDMGDGRRASIKKAGGRRASGPRRKDSIRPARTETREATRKRVEDEQDQERARRHRRIAMIILGTFLFLLTASVLVVVVTLTNSSFLSPPTGSRELNEHRAQLRKENEELLNSLNRDTSVPGNTTVPP